MFDVLKTYADVAGIAGIALGILLYLYKRIELPSATSRQLTFILWSSCLVVLVALLFWFILKYSELQGTENTNLNDSFSNSDTQTKEDERSPTDEQIMRLVEAMGFEDKMARHLPMHLTSTTSYTKSQIENSLPGDFTIEVFTIEDLIKRDNRYAVLKDYVREFIFEIVQASTQHTLNRTTIETVIKSILSPSIPEIRKKVQLAEDAFSDDWLENIGRTSEQLLKDPYLYFDREQTLIPLWKETKAFILNDEHLQQLAKEEQKALERTPENERSDEDIVVIRSLTNYSLLKQGLAIQSQLTKEELKTILAHNHNSEDTVANKLADKILKITEGPAQSNPAYRKLVQRIAELEEDIEANPIVESK